MRGSIYIFCLLVKGGAELGMYRSYRKGTILIELSWGTLESGVANAKPQYSVFQEGKGSPCISRKTCSLLEKPPSDMQHPHLDVLDMY